MYRCQPSGACPRLKVRFVDTGVAAAGVATSPSDADTVRFRLATAALASPLRAGDAAVAGDAVPPSPGDAAYSCSSSWHLVRLSCPA